MSPVTAGPRAGARHDPGLGLDLQSRPALPVPSESRRRGCDGPHGQISLSPPSLLLEIMARSRRHHLGTLTAVGRHGQRSRPPHTPLCALGTRNSDRCCGVWSRPRPPTSANPQQLLPTLPSHRRDAMAAVKAPGPGGDGASCIMLHSYRDAHLCSNATGHAAAVQLSAKKIKQWQRQKHFGSLQSEAQVRRRPQARFPPPIPPPPHREPRSLRIPRPPSSCCPPCRSTGATPWQQ